MRIGALVIWCLNGVFCFHRVTPVSPRCSFLALESIKPWVPWSTRHRLNADKTMKQQLNNNLMTCKRRRSSAWGVSTRIAVERHLSPMMDRPQECRFVIESFSAVLAGQTVELIPVGRPGWLWMTERKLCCQTFKRLDNWSWLLLCLPQVPLCLHA